MNALGVIETMLFIIAVGYFIIISPICIVHLVKHNKKINPLPTLFFWFGSPLMVALVALILAVVLKKYEVLQ